MNRSFFCGVSVRISMRVIVGVDVGMPMIMASVSVVMFV